jgi:hypothetical protein
MLPIEPPVLTVIPGRSPAMKAHWRMSDAKRAVLARLGYNRALDMSVTDTKIEVYRWDDIKGWLLLWSIPEGTEEAHLPWY